MARELTAKQNKFIDGICNGLTQSEAYRQAGYKTSGMTVETLAREAHRLANAPNISPIIAQRKKEMANKAIWDRETALLALAEIFESARAFSVTQATDMFGNKINDKETDEPVFSFNSKAAQTAIKAIEQANKMCGYNEPDKQEHSGEIKIMLSNELEQWAK